MLIHSLLLGISSLLGMSAYVMYCELMPPSIWDTPMMCVAMASLAGLTMATTLLTIAECKSVIGPVD